MHVEIVWRIIVLQVAPKKPLVLLIIRHLLIKLNALNVVYAKKSCLHGAIVEIIRPCEQACELAAIKSDKDRRASIDYNLCVQCGKCKMACPFGAIGEQSFIVQLIQEIKAHKRVMDF